MSLAEEDTITLSIERNEETKESDIDIYVVTDKPGNNRIDYEAIADVGIRASKELL